MKNKILYSKPSITELEERYAADAVRTGWGPHCYDYLDKFEKQFSDYIGSKFAVATSCGTGAMQLGLAALGIGAGDEVILADTNWVASVAPVVHLGATPVFVDICPDTWCLDPVQVEKAITPRTKAIIAVHLYGNLCDMEALEAIASRYNLLLIEDAAEAIGSHWNGRFAGTRGTFGIFSFHGTKTVTTGEGGMLVSDDADFVNRVRTLNNHGRVAGDTRQFWATVVGYKFKMSNVQAAIGCAQLDRIAELVDRKREIFFAYKAGLSDLPVTMNPVPEDCAYGYWMPTVVFEAATSVTQKQVLGMFKQDNIDGRAFFPPLSGQADFALRNNPYSQSIALRAVNLPSYHDMTDSDQQRVINVIREACNSSSL